MTVAELGSVSGRVPPRDRWRVLRPVGDPNGPQHRVGAIRRVIELADDPIDGHNGIGIGSTHPELRSAEPGKQRVRAGCSGGTDAGPTGRQGKERKTMADQGLDSGDRPIGASVENDSDRGIDFQ
jgi:hypothetical protein